MKNGIHSSSYFIKKLIIKRVFRTFSYNNKNVVYNQDLYAFNKEYSYSKYNEIELKDNRYRIINKSVYRKQFYSNSLNYLLKSFISIKKDAKSILYIGHNPYEFIEGIYKCKSIQFIQILK